MRSVCIAISAVAVAASLAAAEPVTSQYSGSASCRSCHERFYQLWAPSHHGLAMQPFTPELARAELGVAGGALKIGDSSYRVELDERGGRVIERRGENAKTYPIAYALGGKNIYYFLTPFERGRLQVLPLSYDVNAREWFDTAKSAMRHFSDASDEALDWREWPFTFNTACFGCHVSQLETNYDLADDSYDSTWNEPGINCETCHGPATEHVRAFRAAPEGQPPAELGLISAKVFDADQTNDLCGSCHAKRVLLTTTFEPGERFFDHFGLAALEDPDFYPDGRDLGENYTYTSWLTSPCVRASELDCLHCHTSSGRFRQADDPDASCLPCHAERVAAAPAHTRHAADSPGSRCIACHMPKSWFARMERHDHSMRPPTPALTIAHASPNACNLCHTDHDAAWSDGWVRKWRERDYQAPVLLRAGLIAAAREEDWARLPEMLDFVSSGEPDGVFVASLIRLLRGRDDDAIRPALIDALGHPSPLVRAAAAEALGDRLEPETIPLLVEATRDEFLIVRVRAAAALAPVPSRMIDPAKHAAVERATAELVASLTSRPDDPFSHYNLANLQMARGQYLEAIASYETALRLREKLVAALVNAAHAYNLVGRGADAERSLRRAVEIEPESGAAQFNLGLLLGEQGRNDEARQSLRAALEADPELAAAAFNLGVLLAETNLPEALRWLRVASDLRDDDPRYAYTLGYFQHEAGDEEGAISTLRGLIDREPGFADAYALLGSIYEQSGRTDAARGLYRSAVEQDALPTPFRQQAATRLRSMTPAQ